MLGSSARAQGQRAVALLLKSRPSSQAAAQVSRSFSTNLECSGCRATLDGAEEPLFTCPNQHSIPQAFHVLQPQQLQEKDVLELVNGGLPRSLASDEANPFVRYRPFLFSYRVAIARGMTDEDYVALIDRCAAAIAKVDSGRALHQTPLTWDSAMGIFLKEERVGVAMSHKSRHLFNIMAYLMVLRATSSRDEAQDLAQRRLAVASCGNAGIAAATIARALDWPIDVCIPDTANAAVVGKLRDDLCANILFCGRDEPVLVTTDGRELDLTGSPDPCVAAFKSLVDNFDAIPFSVQGTECGLAAEGAKTIAWELVEQLAQSSDWKPELPARVFVQVGGGALASGVSQGFNDVLGSPAHGGGALKDFFPVESLGGAQSLDSHPPRQTQPPQLHCVQAEGNQPLVRAMNRLAELKVIDPSNVTKVEADVMTAWDSPASIAYGILDDITYDWTGCAEGMLGTGGGTVTVSDASIVAAHEALHQREIAACHTGAVSLAGALQTRANSHAEYNDVVLVTGASRE